MSLIDEYLSHGWRLTPVPSGTKGPRLPGWNTRVQALDKASDLPTNYGVGLMHAYSGTMALDIDDWILTKEFGIDIDALYAAPDAVQIVSGRVGRGKLLYRMPFGIVLPSKKFTKDLGRDENNRIIRKTVCEFRCGTIEGLTVQDILPPSVHPETGRPYEWGGAGHWTRLPYCPPQILRIWEESIKDIQPPSADGVDSSWDEIQAALNHINPDCPRDEWIRIGMVLHWAGQQTWNNDQAFAIWNTWSAKGTKYVPREMVGQWNSFRATKNNTVTLGTLFAYARRDGWVRPQPDASSLFESVIPARPVDIMTLLRPAPPPIDLDLWPPVLARRAREVSTSVGCDPLVPLWSGLGAVCGAIDARCRLELAPGFEVPPVLWLMTLGDPADKKTPDSKPMMKTLTDLEAMDAKRYAQACQEWDIKEAIWSREMKACMEYINSSTGLLDPAAAPPHPGDKPAKPVPERITVDDVTSQKLVDLCSDRPRGLLCYLDEMHSWVAKVCNKMSGEDRSAWVRSYESSRYILDRIQRGSTCADNFAVSIYGNIQPRVLMENFKDLTQDGLLQRFLPAVLRSDQTRISQPIPEMFSSASAWEMLLRTVYSVQPTNYRLSPEAREVYRAFQIWYEDRKRVERLVHASPTYMTAYGKLEGLAGRLALVFQVMEAPFNIEVSADVMSRVVRIIKEYVIPVYRYLYDTDESSASSFDLWVTEHIIHMSDLPGISMSDIKKSARRQLERAGIKNTNEQSQWVLNAMGLLEDRGWVARADDKSQEHRGIAQWLINPYLKTTFAEYRKAVVQAKVERDYDRLSKAGLDRPTAIHGADILET